MLVQWSTREAEKVLQAVFGLSTEAYHLRTQAINCWKSLEVTLGMKKGTFTLKCWGGCIFPIQMAYSGGSLGAKRMLLPVATSCSAHVVKFLDEVLHWQIHKFLLGACSLFKGAWRLTTAGLHTKKGSLAQINCCLAPEFSCLAIVILLAATQNSLICELL